MPEFDSTPSPSVSANKIADNVQAVRARMAAAALRVNRAPGEVTLVAVTKSVGVREVEILYELGVRHFGENRPETVAGKIAALPGDAVWHEIGNVQRRKAKLAVELFQRIDAVDRLELAEALQVRCVELGVQRDILIEVNVSGEAAKHGSTATELSQMLDALRACHALHVRGLMTMAPFGATESVLRMVFAGLHALASQHALPVVSMGMTDDYEIAIEEGSTEVRVGRALFA